MRFVDTNVLIYAVSAAVEDAGKQRRALDLLGTRNLALSVQVLREFYVQATRPSRLGTLAHEEAVNFTEALLGDESSPRFCERGVAFDRRDRAENLVMELDRQCGSEYWNGDQVGLPAGIGRRGPRRPKRRQ